MKDRKARKRAKQAVKLADELRENVHALVAATESAVEVLDTLANIDLLQGLRLDILDGRVDALEAGTDETPLPTEAQRLVKLALAVEAEANVQFDYVDAEGTPSAREVSPYTIEYARGRPPLLVGYDLARDGIRRFRVDRISAVERGGLFEYVSPESD